MCESDYSKKYLLLYLLPQKFLKPYNTQIYRLLNFCQKVLFVYLLFVTHLLKDH